MIIAIVAKALNNVIGKNGTIPWEIKEDLAFFKQQTLHHYILMGRRSFEDIKRPLPQRKNLVLSSTLAPQKDITIVSSLQEAIDIAKDEDLYICGGAKLYEEAMPYCEYLYVTQINEIVEGDTYFPEISDDFEIIERRQGQGNYEFLTYKRIK